MNRKGHPKLVREIVGGESYEYYPLGKHIVSAPGICGGRPTFKYTRIEVQVVLDLLAAGHSLEQLVKNYQGRVSGKAIQEALELAASSLKYEAAYRQMAQDEAREVEALGWAEATIRDMPN